MAVAELNLLRPDVVLTVGNLVPGLRRDGASYVAEAEHVRGELEQLKMPWYPCAGERDIVSGTREAGDRRFEGLFQKYQGPLYYSVDTGDMHAVVLDSEQMAGGGIEDDQVRWLRGDLSRAFDVASSGKGPKWVVVVMGRPLWRDEAKSQQNGWDRVHRALVEFNRRPIVVMEGPGGFNGENAADRRGPRVVAVVAGGERAYAMDPPMDGIGHFVMGPTAARPRQGEDASEAVRGMMLMRFDGNGTGQGAGEIAGVHTSVIGLGGEGPLDGQMVMPADVITAREREVIDAMAGWRNDVMGITGFVDERSGVQKEKGLRLELKNPFTSQADKVDMALRSASTSFLTGSRREGANTYVEGFDLPWEMTSAHMLRQLSPGEKIGWDLGFERAEVGAGVDSSPPPPPQVDILVHWADPRGRTHEVILKRRVALATRARVTIEKKENLWKEGTATGGAYAWEIRGDEPRKLNPSWTMAADDQRLYVKMQVDDHVHSYWPRMVIDPAWGGLASDAVSVAWAKDEKAKPEEVKRIWVVPFGPKGAEVWTNDGVGEKQTELLKLDPKWGVTAEVKEEKGYEVTISLPRALVFGQKRSATTAPSTSPVVVDSAMMDIAVADNDQAARTWVRSWSKEELGPPGWNKLELMSAATAPATNRK
jgi:hypothetical protein